MSMKSITDGYNTAQSFTFMSLMGTQQYFDCPQTRDDVYQLILPEEVEAAVKTLKMGNAAGVGSIPAELFKQEEKP